MIECHGAAYSTKTMAMVPPIDLDADDLHAAGGRFAPRHLDRRVIRPRATLPALEGDSTMTDANQQHIALLREKSRVERGDHRRAKRQARLN